MVRLRHSGGTSTREHLGSAVDFTSPSDSLYGSEMDLEPVTVVDIGAGSVTDGSIVPGGLDGGGLVRIGTLPPVSFDQTPPALPTNIVVTSELVRDADGGSIVAIKVSMDPPTDSDYFSTNLEATDLTDGDPVTPTPIWTNPLTAITGKGIQYVYFLGVAGRTSYWVRMRTVDTQGNYSAYTGVFSVTTVGDTEAPSIPQSPTGAGGYKSIGVRWIGASDSDLMTYEVRYTPDLGGGPDASHWETLKTRGNSLYIGGLAPGDYWAQVRAIDYSRNVVGCWAMTSSAATDYITCSNHTFVNNEKILFSNVLYSTELIVEDLWVINAAPTTFQVSASLGGAAVGIALDGSGFVSQNPTLAVDYLGEPESGWSRMVGPFTASLVGAADVAFNSVITDILSANRIDAETIEAGVLRVSSAQGTADGIKVALSGVDIGSWDDTGLFIRSKDAGRSALDFVHVDDASISVYLNGVVTYRITPDGIDASSVNFGTAQGGHNLVYNSSFELSDFTVQSSSTIGSGGSTFAGAVGGWVLVSNTNVTVAAASLTMTA